MKTQLKVNMLALVALSHAIPTILNPTILKNAHDVETLTSPVIPADVPDATNATSKGYTYVGCHTDDRRARVLSQKSMYLANMTTSACSNFCSDTQYFGTEYYSECYCSNILANTSLPVKDEDCWMPCSGSSTEACGGTDRISVFKSTTWTPPPTPPKNIAIPSYEYRGCYVDKVGDRTLNGQYFLGGNMTTTACASFCNNSTYFGTEYGGECYCASTIPAQAQEVDSKECSTACKGDTTQACGGGNRLSVYWRIPGFKA
jgi:hypothetical protein